MKKFFASVAAAAVMAFGMAPEKAEAQVAPGQGFQVPTEGGGFNPPTVVPPEGGTPTINVGGNENNLNQGQEQGQNQGQNQGQDQSQGQNQGQDQSQTANGGNGYGGAGGNGYGQGGAGGTGGNVGNITNSFRSYVATNAPSLNGYVSGCMATKAVGGGLQIGPVSGALTVQGSTYNQECAADQRDSLMLVTLTGYLATITDQNEKAVQYNVLMDIFPEYRTAVAATVYGNNEYQARCNANGPQRVAVSFLDLMAGATTCTTATPAPAANAGAAAATTTTVEINFNDRAQRPTATAPRRAPAATTPRRAPAATTPRRTPAAPSADCAAATAAAARAEAARVRACTVPAPRR